MGQIYQIAIDGPSGAGKSTIAKLVAKKKNIDYIDTGAMYRAFGYKMYREGIPMVENDFLASVLENTDIDFSNGHVILDGEIVDDVIRTPEIAKYASDCSAFRMVRNKMVAIQQELGRTKSVIMDGRDICDVVLKDAKYKYYLTATVEERALRRYKELLEKGEEVSLKQVVGDITKRDHNDMTRDVTPLHKADDAIEIDSSKMTIDEVVDFICDRIEE